MEDIFIDVVNEEKQAKKRKKKNQEQTEHGNLLDEV